MNSASGSIDIAITKGFWPRDQIASWPTETQRLLGGTDAGVPFNCIAGRFDVSGGIASLRFSVFVDNLQPHEKGATFDLITEAEDGLGLIWTERSRMLCRGMKLEGEPAPDEAPPALPLSELTRWYADSDIGRRYAKVCGDYNPIHLSAATARLFGFPQAIAHGMWSKAMALAALRGHLPLSGYEVDVAFHKPVRLPSEVVLHSSAVAPDGQFRLAGHDALEHMVGSWRTLHESSRPD